MEDVTLGLAFIAGLLSFVSPCVLPLVPAYIGYMGGRMTHTVATQTATKAKVGESGSGNDVIARANMLLHGLVFVLGFTLVFVAIGLMTTAFVSVIGSSVSVLTEIIGRIGGIVIIFFGLHFMGALQWFFNWLKKQDGLLDSVGSSLVIGVLASILILWGFVQPIVGLPIVIALWLAIGLGGGFTNPGEFWNKIINTVETALYTDTRHDLEAGENRGLSGTFFMGVVFSAGWTPCIGPLLGTILTVAAQTGDVGQAVPMLIAYSLGLGIPFILTALLLESAQGLLRRLQQHMHKIELASGALLIAIGILVASGSLQNLSSTLATGEQADLSIRIEECGVGFFTGELAFNQVGSCLGGSLHLISVGQSAGGELSPNRTQLEYLFDIETATDIDVEINNLGVENVAEDLPMTISLLNEENEEVATSNQLQLLEDDDYLALDDVALSEAGRYRVIITADAIEIEERFRVRIQAADTDTITASSDDSEDDSESEGAVSDLAQEGVNSIEEAAEESGAPVGTNEGNRAPDFMTTTLSDEEVSLSDLRGQVVLLNFWGTWCGPCRREMPEFQSLYEEYGDKNFTILAMAVRDTEKDMREFKDEFGLTFPLALDVNNEVNEMYGIVNQPSSLVIDANGVIIRKFFGITLESQLKEILDEQLPVQN